MLLGCVDNVIIAKNIIEYINELKSEMDKKLPIKDLGNLKYLLSLEIAHSR